MKQACPRRRSARIPGLSAKIRKQSTPGGRLQPILVLMPNAAASRLVLEPFSEKAVTTASREALQEIGGHVTCALVFCSADYRADLADFVELIQFHAHAPLVVGCSGSGLLGTEYEAEGGSGFSLLLLHLPETRVQAISFDAARLESLASPAAWHEFTGSPASEPGGWIVLADPFSLPVEQWLERWNAAYPNLTSVGGLASGGRTGDDVFVFRDGHLQEGAVALGLFGGVRLHPVISQGCRPIGEPFTITGADDNLVTSLGSRPAFERLVETVECPARARTGDRRPGQSLRWAGHVRVHRGVQDGRLSHPQPLRR